MAPYADNPEEWTKLEWCNVYDPDGATYRIATDRDASAEAGLVVVKCYQHVLREYRLHPEHKFHVLTAAVPATYQRSARPRAVNLATNDSMMFKRLYADSGEVLSEYNDPDNSPLHQLALPALERIAPATRKPA